MINTLVLMSKLPIHKNLNTSFVNLAALVRHLRSLQFVGSIQIELSSYEAEIEFTEGGTIMAREQDHTAGRISFGEEALQRIMIRAKESGGLIHVYKSSAFTGPGDVFIDEAISAGARRMAAGPLEAAVWLNERSTDLFANPPAAEVPIPKPDVVLEHANTDNWAELLGLISEVLQTVDGSLAKANFNFADAFRNACGFVSVDHPFLDPESDVFSYEDGYISVRKQLANRELISGVMAALGRIMLRLREDPYFGNVFHQTMHRLRVLAHRRKLQCELFGLTREIQKITGI